MPVNNNRRDFGEVTPKVPVAPVKVPALPPMYGDMKKGYKRP